MGTIKKPDPVKLFTAMISSQEELIAEALKKLQNKYGGCDFISPVIPFNFTEYYEEEMGTELKRQFASFKELVSPDILPEAKLFTNKLEEDLGYYEAGGLRRKINLDPGYICLSKLILASTKDFSHRIYLREGIFAEITMQWRNKQWEFHRWTFPDYKSKSYLDYFTKLRNIYHAQLKDIKQA